MSKIAVLIEASLHNEIVLRMRSSKDVSGVIENVIENFLERTAGEEGIWSSEYIAEYEEREFEDWSEKYGDPKKGYHWNVLFLPNATKLKMNYKGSNHFAEIRHGKIMDGDCEHSPSEWVSKVANHTSRNAWRDIYVQLPGTRDWALADILRLKKKEQAQ